MRHAALLGIVICGLWMGGCSTSKEQPPKQKSVDESVPPPAELGQRVPSTPGPSRPDPIVWLDPGDMLTSVGASPIRAWVDNDGSPVDPRLLDAIAANLELREYPSLAVVPATTSIYNPQEQPVSTESSASKDASVVGQGGARGSSQNERAYVQLAPSKALQLSWYVVSLRNIPNGVRLAPWSAPTPPSGAYAARFHTGSQPVLTRALFCQKGGEQWRSILEFSENIKVAGDSTVDALVEIDQPGSGKRCKYASAGPLANSSMRWLDMDCVGFSKSGSVRVAINPGLESAAGVPVRRFDGSTVSKQEIELSKLPESEDGCRVWRF